MAAHLWTLRRMSLSVAGMLQAGETPNLEAALVKDLGNAFEREIPELVRLLGAGPPPRRQRPVRGGAGRDRAARPVLHPARRHPRDPARHHRPRPRPAMRRGDAMPSSSTTARCGSSPISLRPRSGDRRRGRGTWPAALWQAVEEAGYPDVLAEGAVRRAWPTRRRSCAPPATCRADPAGRDHARALAVRRLRARGAGGRAHHRAGRAGGSARPRRRPRVSGHAGYVPWARDAAAVVLIAGNTLLVVPQGAAISPPARTSPASRATISARSSRAAARRRCPMRSTCA